MEKITEYDVNFGKDWNLTVIMPDSEFQAYWSDIVYEEYEDNEPDIDDEIKIQKVMEKWATDELECDDFETNSATFRPFPGRVTSASRLD